MKIVRLGISKHRAPYAIVETMLDNKPTYTVYANWRTGPVSYAPSLDEAIMYGIENVRLEPNPGSAITCWTVAIDPAN